MENNEIVVASSALTEQVEHQREKSPTIGEILVANGRLSQQDVRKIQEEQDSSNIHFGQAALKLNLLTVADLEQALSAQFGYAYFKADDVALHPSLQAAVKPFGKVSEQIRSLRVRLLLSQLTVPTSRTCAVASARSGEGKSFIAANLAIVFAQLGERTLLIDADMRNPVQHVLFGLDNRVGLSNVLLGRASLDSAVTIERFSALSILPSGARAPNPQELLARSNFTRLLLEAGKTYDYIVVDTPPVGDFADAQLICSRTSATVFITRPGLSNKISSGKAISVLKESGARVVGAVVNG